MLALLPLPRKIYPSITSPRHLVNNNLQPLFRLQEGMKAMPRTRQTRSSLIWMKQWNAPKVLPFFMTNHFSILMNAKMASTQSMMLNIEKPYLCLRIPSLQLLWSGRAWRTRLAQTWPRYLCLSSSMNHSLSFRNLQKWCASVMNSTKRRSMKKTLSWGWSTWLPRIFHLSHSSKLEQQSPSIPSWERHLN